MKKCVHIILCVLLVALLASSILVGCNKDNGYTFTVQSIGGAKLEGVTITLKRDGQQVGKPAVTNAKGIATFDVEQADYTYEISGLPNGYYFEDAADAQGQTGGEKKITLSYPSKITAEARKDRMYREGDIFFDFSVNDVVEGKTYKLSEVLADKKMVLINFWNTSCGPCVSEMPGLNIAYKEYKDKVQVLAISSILFAWDSEAEVGNFASGNENDPYEFPMFADSTSGNYFYQYLDLTSLPTNVIIDRYGMIAKIHRGRSGTDQFLKLFEKYSSDDYKQDVASNSSGESGDDEPERERIEPNVKQADSASIKKAINGEGFSGEWYPESGTADAKYSWPWAVDTLNGEKVLKPTNHYVDYSFATIKTKVTISEDDIKNGGKVALVFDLKYSTELWADYFYVIVNSNMVYSFTGTEHWDNWQRCYAFVADEPGEYEVSFLYDKDDLSGGGEDTVCIKNVRLISAEQVNEESETLDMPRDAAKDWNDAQKKFDRYATARLGADGFYHYGDEDGPYLLADLYNKALPFNIGRGFEMTISEAAVGELFKDKDGTDMASEVTPYLQAANNSELAGLTVVDKTLHDLLNAFAEAKYPECDDNAWLEFCTWFEHYGSDSSDKGISTFDRNPVRGLMTATAIPMKEVHQGRFDDTSDIDEKYMNNVVIDRVIMPRGIMYKLTPDKSGAYRFRSQSSELSDTTAWLRAEGMDVNHILTEFGEEREDPDASFNFIMTWYLEEGKTYYLSVSLADVGGTGEFTFTTEYLGDKFYSWQAVSRALATFEEGENGEMGALKNYYNAYPVLAEDGFYYDAVRNEDGTPKLDAQGNMTPDMNDPIYVDFLHGTRFMEQSIERIIAMSDTNDILARLKNDIFPKVFENVPSNVAAITSLIVINGGAALTDEVWERLATQISVSYGDTVSFDNETFAELRSCSNVFGIIQLLQKYYFNAFDFSGWVGASMVHFDVEGNPVLDANGNPVSVPMWEYLGMDSESDLKDYTNDIKKYLKQAKAKTQADHSEEEYGGIGFDAGCLKLDKSLCKILQLFAQRYGWTGLHTDWMRLCYHYEYIGPYEG